MKYTIRRSVQFKKDVKNLQRGGKDMEKLLSVIGKLAEGKTLSKNYCDHPLLKASEIAILKMTGY